MGATESWVTVHPDGTIVMHVENDGWRFMRRGPEESDTIVTLEQLKSYPSLYESAKAQLAKLGK
jgi:hypothetical protein